MKLETFNIKIVPSSHGYKLWHNDILIDTFSTQEHANRAAHQHMLDTLFLYGVSVFSALSFLLIAIYLFGLTAGLTLAIWLGVIMIVRYFIKI
jgi:hypothetical protein